MYSKFAAATAIGLLGLLLTACGATPIKPVEVTIAAPTISDEAKKALAQAEADVAAAKEKFALWTTAVSALKAARKAVEAGDSVGVINHANYASGQAWLGIAQLDYPSTEKK